MYVVCMSCMYVHTYVHTYIYMYMCTVTRIQEVLRVWYGTTVVS
jgi:hypothetical protein